MQKKNDDPGSFKAETLREIKKEGKFFLLHWYDFIALSVRKELRQRPKEFFLLFVLALIISVAVFSFLFYSFVAGIQISFSLPTFQAPNFAQFQILGNNNSSSNKFDPVVLASKIKKGEEDFVLIDTRSKEEFEEGHITTAISVPVYGTSLLKPDGSIDRGKVKEAFKGKTDKSIIVLYGHSAYSTYPYDVAAVLGKRTKVLGIGWNEWAHFKTLWIPESLWSVLDDNQFVQMREE